MYVTFLEYVTWTMLLPMQMAAYVTWPMQMLAYVTSHANDSLCYLDYAMLLSWPMLLPMQMTACVTWTMILGLCYFPYQ